MKYSPEHATGAMPNQTAELLAELREQRNFDPEQYLDAKAQRLNEYMANAGLESCAIALSGGIDSSAVAGIIDYARRQPESPIKKVYAITEPVYHDEFTKNQDDATVRAREVAEAFGFDLIELDLTSAYDALKATVDEGVGEVGEPWAAGQLVAYLRTPAIYYVTSLMTQRKEPGIVCGTTNRDEGAYLGYVGKASDGIVDVQLISDLHKSEVRAISAMLGVPQSVMDATPTGDMFDGRVDEEVFGAPYDYVELLLLLKSIPREQADALIDSLPDEEWAVWDEAWRNLEALHSYNAHKYLVGSPAVHLDVMESGVPHGWAYGRQKVERTPRNPEAFKNAFNLRNKTFNIIRTQYEARPETEADRVDLPKGEAQLITNVLSDDVRRRLLKDADAHGWVPAAVDGYTEHYKPGDPVGSLRSTTFSPELADLLWSRVAKHLDAPRIFGEDPQTDVVPRSIWRPIGVSPVMRFIGYEDGGLLVPHYDSPYVYNDGQMTLKSLVAYLQADNIRGGETRFLRDDRIGDPIATRNLDDRTEFARGRDVIASIDPSPGSALVFDHRLLHDSKPIKPLGKKARKVILRTDVVYQQC